MILSLEEIARVEAQALADGIPLEDVEYVWGEYEQQIEAVQLILPPGVRSVAELEDLAGQEQDLTRIWTPETNHLFED